MPEADRPTPTSSPDPTNLVSHHPDRPESVASFPDQTVSPEVGQPEPEKLGFLANLPTWKTRLNTIWNQTQQQVKKRLSLEQITQSLTSWFTVSDQQVATILETVRSQLPTTEALLLGKPQVGKSSLVRGLTGATSDIVGQGFRPHTQHTQRYSYPSEELPLLIFTDTVGLGDGEQDTGVIVGELLGSLQGHGVSRDLDHAGLDQAPNLPKPWAKILILTVKISDFATDRLRQIAQGIRQQYPHIPCLLAVTCLHEVYPPHLANHPPYPPDLEGVQRSFQAIQADFQGLFDRAVLLDFTLDEDGFTPVFYGLEALRDVLGDLLPEAEARTIHQLLDDYWGNELGSLYRDVGRRSILPFCIIAATLAAVPLPFATMPALTALQISMVGLLGRLYGQTLTPSQAGGLVSTIAGGFVAQTIGRELVKLVPGFGSVVAASWAATYTWALGETACVYFGDLLGGKNLDPDRIQRTMEESFQAAQDRFKPYGDVADSDQEQDDRDTKTMG